LDLQLQGDHKSKITGVGEDGSSEGS
jgi:hypothetical protein